MSWATHAIEKLQRGETVQLRPRGNSMRGKVESGQLVTVEPVGSHELKKGTIVLCKVRGRHYLHLIKATRFDGFSNPPAPKPKPSSFLIGNNRGGTNGWIGSSSIYGVCTKVE